MIGRGESGDTEVETGTACGNRIERLSPPATWMQGRPSGGGRFHRCRAHCASSFLRASASAAALSSLPFTGIFSVMGQARLTPDGSLVKRCQLAFLHEPCFET